MSTNLKKQKTTEKVTEIQIGEKTNLVVSNKKENYLLEVFVFIISISLATLLTYCSQYLTVFSNILERRIFQCLIYVGFIVLALISLALIGEFKSLKIEKRYLFLNILYGLLIALLFTFFIGLLPLLINSGDRNVLVIDLDAIGFKLIFDVIFVGFGEELFFRGYLLRQFRKWFKHYDFFAPLVVGLIFGLWHLINGSWQQMIITSLLGVSFGYLVYYLKHCNWLSVSLGHGIYNFLLYTINYLPL